MTELLTGTLPPGVRSLVEALWLARTRATADRRGAGTDPEQAFDVAAFLDARGVILVHRPMDARGPDGIYGGDEGDAFIVVNADKPAWQQRYVAAHLFGHHACGFEHGLVVDQDALGAQGPAEDAANAYAGCLLMPLDGLDRFMSGLRAERPGAAWLDLGVVEALAERYGVPYRAVVWHLLTMGLVRPEQLRGLPPAEVARWLRSASGGSHGAPGS